MEVVSLRLVDERFYHLDTCFCPLNGGYLLYYPGAFDDHARSVIARRVPANRRIAISEKDAVKFACNAVNIDDSIILNHISDELRRKLEKIGFLVIETDLSEFLKAGGGTKCLTLRLNEPRFPALSTIESAHSLGQAIHSL
jgi:N-dimethylarginine dimethylaminohydrolase